MTSQATLRVSHDELQAYLEVAGWHAAGQVRNVARVWRRSDTEDAELLVPASPEIKDYDARLREAVETLAKFERRSVEVISNDILGKSRSIIAVRVIAEDTSNGSIPIEDGVLLIRKAKELLYSAAMATYSKRRQFNGSPPREAKAYMDSLLLGQTEVGSYVVNVIAPADLGVSVAGWDAETVSLSEIVAHSLVVSLAALADASGKYWVTSEPSVFENAVASGASSNMCDALLGFSGKNRSRNFEIQVRTPSGPLFGSHVPTFIFDSNAVEALEVASSYYKNDYVLLNREIIGSVKHLDRGQTDEVGTITVQAPVGEMDRSVKIQLGPEEYHLGVIAHDKKMVVSCTGDVHVKGRSTWLLNPRGFRIVEMPTLF